MNQAPQLEQLRDALYDVCGELGPLRYGVVLAEVHKVEVELAEIRKQVEDSRAMIRAMSEDTARMLDVVKAMAKS